MNRADLATLAALHAELLLDARRSEAYAAAGGIGAEDDATDAQIARHRADALATLLESQGVHVPLPGTLSLFNDGGPA